MAELVNKIRNIDIIKGSRYFKVTKEEIKNKVQLRRSIAVNKNISKGSKIKKSDLIMLRPGTGLNYKFFKKVIGRSAKVNLKKSIN